MEILPLPKFMVPLAFIKSASVIISSLLIAVKGLIVLASGATFDPSTIQLVSLKKFELSEPVHINL